MILKLILCPTVFFALFWNNTYGLTKYKRTYITYSGEKWLIEDFSKNKTHIAHSFKEVIDYLIPDNIFAKKTLLIRRLIWKIFGGVQISESTYVYKNDVIVDNNIITFKTGKETWKFVKYHEFE